MANKRFTFWENMKEAIDVYEGKPEFQYKLYDALTEYGLYGTWPEDDGSIEAKTIIMFIQSILPSLEKSSEYLKKQEEYGTIGGRASKVSDEQIKEAIESCAERFRRVPTRREIVEEIERLFEIKVSDKTISRRFPDEKKKRIAEGTLGQNWDKTNVSEGQNMSQGQNGDKIKCPDVPVFFEF